MPADENAVRVVRACVRAAGLGGADLELRGFWDTDNKHACAAQRTEHKNPSEQHKSSQRTSDLFSDNHNKIFVPFFFVFLFFVQTESF